MFCLFFCAKQQSVEFSSVLLQTEWTSDLSLVNSIVYSTGSSCVQLSCRAKGMQTFVPICCWLHPAWVRAVVMKEFPLCCCVLRFSLVIFQSSECFIYTRSTLFDTCHLHLSLFAASEASQSKKRSGMYISYHGNATLIMWRYLFEHITFDFSSPPFRNTYMYITKAVIGLFMLGPTVEV